MSEEIRYTISCLDKYIIPYLPAKIMHAFRRSFLFFLYKEKVDTQTMFSYL
jgi:hypothetical protein